MNEKPARTATIETKGDIEVPIRTKQHEKARLTIVPTAQADCEKSKPYVSIARGQSIQGYLHNVVG